MNIKNKETRNDTEIEEVFLINDIDMNIGPSDIQVVDDNWVMEESYIRSKAVFCFRSKYSATKVTINIPFQITYLDEDSKEGVNNTFNCIKLITELNAYPFCFIKNHRLKTYISPTSSSATGYMMFAVDEIGIVQDSKASNMVFLELVLQFFNHQPLISDFEFRSNLPISLSDIVGMDLADQESGEVGDKDVSYTGKTLVKDIAPIVVSSLSDSVAWKSYINPKVVKVFNTMQEQGLFDVVNENPSVVHPMMSVKLLAPQMSIITQGLENTDDGILIGPNTRVITVTDTTKYDNGSFENLINTMTKQDFSNSVFEKEESVETLNSEMELKSGNLKYEDHVASIGNAAKNKAQSVFKTLDEKQLAENQLKENGKAVSLKEAYENQQLKNTVDGTDKKAADPSNPNNSKDVFIQWVGKDIQQLSMGIQTIEVRRKNRIVSHQIGAFKHPIIQYLGKYPTTVTLSMASVNYDVYKNEDYPTDVFIKQILNILDYNRATVPEAEAYNFIKVHSLGTILLDSEAYLPAQNIVSASANQQGVENIVYSLVEGDLTEFLEQSKVEASGKLSSKSESKVIEMIIKWLLEFQKQLSGGFGSHKEITNSNMRIIHSFEIYKLIIQLAAEASTELDYDKYDHRKALDTALDLLEDLKPNNDQIYENLYLLKNKLPTEFSNHILYTTANKMISNIESNRNAFAQRNMTKEQRDYINSFSKANSTTISLSMYHQQLIPFLIRLLRIRGALITGGTTTVPNTKFVPSARFNTISNSIINKINSGIQNAEPISTIALGTQSNIDFLKNYIGVHSNSFFGYNLEDLELETLSPIAYDRSKDVFVQNLDPFFFLVERKLLNETEMPNFYDAMYLPNTDIDEIVKVGSTNTNDEIGEADVTTQIPGLEYRKLKEIDYEVNSGGGTPSIISSGDEVNAFFSSGGQTRNPARENLGKNKIAPEVVDAIERALKKYNKDKDQVFRNYMYAVLLTESTNGTDLGTYNNNDAQGLFQIKGISLVDIMTLNNNVTFSDGRQLLKNLPKEKAKEVAYGSKGRTGLMRSGILITDHYANAQLFIEYAKRSNQLAGNRAVVNGVTNPIYAFAAHNIGPTSFNDVMNFVEGKTTKLLPLTKTTIEGQRKDLIGVDDAQTINNYFNLVKSKINVNNVPDSVVTQLQFNKNGEKLAKAAGNTPILTPEEIKTRDSIDYKNLADTKQEIDVVTKQKQLRDAATKQYKELTIKPVDKVSTPTTTGKSLNGTVIDVEDGDTYYIKVDGEEKTYTIRMYGIDAPETDHEKIKHMVDNPFEAGSFGTVDTKYLAKFGEIAGDQAKIALESMIKGKRVKVQPTGLDSNGRTVGITTLPDGTNASLVMLRNGKALLSEGFTTIGDYNKAHLEAKNKSIGLYAYPPGIITRPREKQVELTPNLIKAAQSQTNYQKFTDADLKYASVAGASPVNEWQPFKGKTFRVSSPFGMRTITIKGVTTTKMHKGVDFACPVGTEVIAAADGVAYTKTNSGGISQGYGRYVSIDHENGFTTIYAHLSNWSVSNGTRVKGGDVIGISGNTGRSSGPHLHYGVSYKGSHINPFGTKQLNLYKTGEAVGSGISTTLPTTPDMDADIPYVSRPARAHVTNENTVFNEDLLAKEIFKIMYKSTNAGLKTTMPAIKVFVTIGNENDSFWLDTLKGGVQYYELKGIKSFHLNCNSDANPIDTVVMTVADPSFLNTDSFAGLSKMEKVNIDKIGTDYEMQFKNNRLQLKPGTKLHIRLGYGPNPNDLSIVFNGAITEVDTVGPQSLQLICEGFGKELLGEIFAPNMPKVLNEQYDNMSSSSVIGEAMLSKAINHFGFSSSFLRDKFRDSLDPEERSLAPGTFSFSYNWGVDFTDAKYKSRMYTNIFAPEIEDKDREFIKYRGWLSSLFKLGSSKRGGYPFTVYRMTPWDTLKQMEYRHPGAKCKPMMYEDRMTLFFGIKEQMYFSKDLNRSAQMLAGDLKNNSQQQFDVSSYYNQRRDRMSPSTNVHLITSNHNLISNGLKISSNYYTSTNINYYQDTDDVAQSWEWDTVKMSMDDNIYPWDLREKELSLSGCIGKYTAFLYGTTDLKKEAEKMYTGKLFIIGNSDMKAGDYAFIDDSERRMHGMILIRECIHHFDEKHGFVTEIVPGQYVEAANFLYSSLWTKLMCCAKIATSCLKTNVGQNFTAKDFNVVVDFLTLINQAEIAMDKLNKNKDATDTENNGWLPILGYGGAATLAAYIVRNLYITLGIKTLWPLSVGSSLTRFTLNSARAYMKTFDSALVKFARDSVKFAYNGSSLQGNIVKGKAYIGGSKFVAFMKEQAETRKLKSGIVWRSTRIVGSVTGRTSLFVAKEVGRAVLATAWGALTSNPAGLVLDLVVMFAINWAFSKVQDMKLTRQPLLFFPIIRHGKPYVGGMSGIVRNTLTNSLLEEGGKTIKEIFKASEIIVGNAKATGDGDNLAVKLLTNLNSSRFNTVKKESGVPLYENDSEGRRFMVNNNRVILVDAANQGTIKDKKSEYIKQQEKDDKIMNLIDDLENKQKDKIQNSNSQ